MIINVCEVFAPNEAAAEEARKGWISRGLTLDLMYENIPGLNNAQLETKNFIYDQLHKVIKELI
jgi:hypothetical protein